LDSKCSFASISRLIHDRIYVGDGNSSERNSSEFCTRNLEMSIVQIVHIELGR